MTKKHFQKHTNNKGLKGALFISGSIHFLIVLFVLLSPPGWLIQPKPPMEVVWVEIPKGIEEDFTSEEPIKESPKTAEKQVQPLKPLPEKSKAMPEPKAKKEKKKKVTQKKIVTTKKEAGSIAKIDEMLKNRDITQAKKANTQGSKYGNSTKGKRNKNYQGALIKYRAQVQAKILRNWHPPSGSSGTISIVVRISRSGSVISTRWGKRSSDGSLNNSAMRAVKAASPFPMPPDVLKSEAYGEGFSVVFNPRRR